jgi:hypothetical protein
MKVRETRKKSSSKSWKRPQHRDLRVRLQDNTKNRTPCSTVLIEKLTGSQLVKKFPTFYGTRRFITKYTSARHLSLS